MSSRYGDALGSMEDDREFLIDRVKALQRAGHDGKQKWWTYCRRNGSCDFDPKRHDAKFLVGFLKEAQTAPAASFAGPRLESYSVEEKALLVQRVKDYQRSGSEPKQLWYTWVNSQGSSDYDPNRHDVSALMRFFEFARSSGGSSCSSGAGSMAGMKGGAGGGCGGGEIWGAAAAIGKGGTGGGWDASAVMAQQQWEGGKGVKGAGMGGGWCGGGWCEGPSWGSGDAWAGGDWSGAWGKAGMKGAGDWGFGKGAAADWGAGACAGAGAGAGACAAGGCGEPWSVAAVWAGDSWSDQGGNPLVAMMAAKGMGKMATHLDSAQGKNAAWYTTTGTGKQKSEFGILDMEKPASLLNQKRSWEPPPVAAGGLMTEEQAKEFQRALKKQR